jgi:hypothetical protein
LSGFIKQGNAIMTESIKDRLPSLLCVVKAIHYDFENQRGVLHMQDGQSCHMPACINLFLAIDPSARWIDTISGGALDTTYARRSGGGWEARDRRPL